MGQSPTRKNCWKSTGRDEDRVTITAQSY